MNKFSTNQIVKEAGIGKGMLFITLRQRKALQLSRKLLFGYSRNIFSFIPEDSPDFIEKLAGISKLKFILHRLPRMGISEQILWSTIEPPEEARKYEEIYAVSMEKFFGNNRLIPVLDDIDAEKAFQLIQWAIKGYQNELLERFKNKTVNMEDVEPLDEFDEYLEI